MGIHTPDAKSQVAAQGYFGRWCRKQSERLGVEPAEIERAILAGWTGDVIAKLPIARAEELAGPPPADAEHEAALQKIKSAPVRPLRLSPRGDRRLDRFTSSRPRPR